MQAGKPKDAAGTLSGQKNIRLETYRKNGEAVSSPVWFMVENGLVYFKTSPNSWKARRLRKNPAVRLAPCTFGGKILGEWLKGTANLVEGEDTKRMKKKINSTHGISGWLVGLFERNRVVYSIKLDSS